MPPDTEKTLKDRLATQHPEYTKRIDLWKFFLLSYEGGWEYVHGEAPASDHESEYQRRGGNLFSHRREDRDDYELRKKRAYFENFCEAIVGIFTGHLFKKPITRNLDENPEFETFLQDVDRHGSSINDFMKNVADLAQILGHVHILVDKPKSNGAILSRSDEAEAGISPFFSTVFPQNLINWETDADGRYLWVRILNESKRQADPFGERKAVKLYRTYTRQAWIEHDGEGNVVDEGEHGLGEVPLVTVYNKRLKRCPIFGRSSLEEIAFVNRALFNLCSLLVEFLYRQCFDILIWPADAPIGEDDSGGEAVLSMSSLMELPGTASFQPYFLSPPTDPMSFLMDIIKDLRHLMFMLSHVEAPSMVASEQSGESKRWDFHETNRGLADLADNLESAENQALTLRGMWMDIAGFDPRVDYPEEFDIKRINDQLEEALKVKAYGLPPAFQKEYDKNLFRKLLPKLPKDTVVKIDEAIESLQNTPTENLSEGEVAAVRRVTEQLKGLQDAV